MNPKWRLYAIHDINDLRAGPETKSYLFLANNTTYTFVGSAQDVFNIFIVGDRATVDPEIAPRFLGELASCQSGVEDVRRGIRSIVSGLVWSPPTNYDDAKQREREAVQKLDHLYEVAHKCTK